MRCRRRSLRALAVCMSPASIDRPWSKYFRHRMRCCSGYRYSPGLGHMRRSYTGFHRHRLPNPFPGISRLCRCRWRCTRHRHYSQPRSVCLGNPRQGRNCRLCKGYRHYIQGPNHPGTNHFHSCLGSYKRFHRHSPCCSS